MKAIILLALICLATVGELVLARHSNLRDWEQYKRQHGKVYETPEEEAKRFSLFLTTRDQIREHNSNDQASYKLGLNHMADWTQEERAQLNGYRYDPIEHEKRLEASRNDPFLQAILDDTTPLPAEVDWRKVPNRITKVKDQGDCSCCWAFAATGVLEGQQVVRNFTKTLEPLSEQDLIDCSERNSRCSGGTPAAALDDIDAYGGIESENDYPYTAVDYDQCLFKKNKSVMSDKGSVSLPVNEQLLKKTVAKYGPVAVTIYASERFQNYKSGVFNDLDCDYVPNRTVLIVGYGNDPEDGDYWIVKNCWSEAWGEEGYIRMNFGTCGIGQESTIAKFDE